MNNKLRIPLVVFSILLIGISFKNCGKMGPENQNHSENTQDFINKASMLSAEDQGESTPAPQGLSDIVCGASPNHETNTVTCLGAGGEATSTHSCYAWDNDMTWYAEVSIDECGDLHDWGDYCCEGTSGAGAGLSTDSSNGTFVGPSSAHQIAVGQESYSAVVRFNKPILKVENSKVLLDK